MGDIQLDLDTGRFFTIEVRRVHFRPTRILRSGNRTIVWWNDGTKTIVKRHKKDDDSIYAAFTAALGIKLYGSNSQLRKQIDKITEFQIPKKKKKKEVEAADVETLEDIFGDVSKYNV